MYRLNIVGCGKVGRVLGAALWHGGMVSQLHLFNRSSQAMRVSRDFIGAGRICESLQEMPKADIWLIAAPDSQLAGIDEKLAGLKAICAETVVFHCSGAYPSSLFVSVKKTGAAVASVHPIHSFADSALALKSFRNTLCSIEGDARAYEVLHEIFTRIGAEVFRISSEHKLVCHAGHVFASNYLVVVLDAARRLYLQAGLPDAIARSCIESLVQSVMTNIAHVGTERALTGPIARGDADLVRAQQAALSSTPEGEDQLDLRTLYGLLARAATDIARRRGELEPEVLDNLLKLVRV